MNDCRLLTDKANFLITCRKWDDLFLDVIYMCCFWWFATAVPPAEQSSYWIAVADADPKALIPLVLPFQPLLGCGYIPQKCKKG